MDPNFSHLQEAKTILSSFEDRVRALEEDKKGCPIILYAIPGLSILAFLSTGSKGRSPLARGGEESAGYLYIDFHHSQL